MTTQNFYGKVGNVSGAGVVKRTIPAPAVLQVLWDQLKELDCPEDEKRAIKESLLKLIDNEYVRSLMVTVQLPSGDKP